MSVEINIEGMDQFKRKIEQLSDIKKLKQITRKAARQAMNVARDSARERARAIDDPKTREMIHKNIATQAGRSRNSNEIVMRVGVRGGAGRNQYSASTASLSGGDTRHWRYLEFGTSHIKAFPFMRLALSKNIDKITEKFVQVFDAEISKVLSEVR